MVYSKHRMSLKLERAFNDKRNISGIEEMSKLKTFKETRIAKFGLLAKEAKIFRGSHWTLKNFHKNKLRVSYFILLADTVARDEGVGN